jgi:hypothetical protein
MVQLPSVRPPVKPLLTSNHTLTKNGQNTRREVKRDRQSRPASWPTAKGSGFSAEIMPGSHSNAVRIGRKSPRQVLENLSLEINESIPVLSWKYNEPDTKNFPAEIQTGICIYRENVLYLENEQLRGSSIE